ncbi:MAG: hypothetical protein JNM51_17785 [Bacteroidia bacterium]|nr:hypothetical protein [Bacteroidia bacterium]
MQEKTWFEVVVGYMLKLMKSGKDTSKFKIQFDHIRHSNYDAFIKEVGVGIPSDIIVYAPQEMLDQDLTHKTYGHFLGMLIASPALQLFYTECYAEFGVITDSDIPDEIFERAAFFESLIRMYADLSKITDDRDDLNNIIEAFCLEKQITYEDKLIIQGGRIFINEIKHINKKKYKKKFKTWDDGIIALNMAYDVLEKHDIKFNY